MFNSYLTLILIFSFGVFITLLILRNWRLGVVFTFVWLYLEDIVRRLLPNQPAGMLLVKDWLLLISYISFFLFLAVKKKSLWKPPFIFVFLLFISLVLIDVLNPAAPNLFFGLIGIRSYLWYAPLIILGYYLFRDENELLKFCKVLVYTAIPLFIIVALQYFFRDSGFPLLNSFDSTHGTHSFSLIGNGGEVPLLSSVFGTGARYSRFAMFLFFLGLGVLVLNKEKERRLIWKNKLLVLSIASAFLGIFLSGIRTAFSLTVIGGILFMFFATNLKNSKPYYLWRRNFFRTVSLGVIILILIVFTFLLFKDTGLFQISSLNDAFGERLSFLYDDFGRAIKETTLFGNGTGTLSQGLESIPGGFDWYTYQTYGLRHGYWFESGFAKVLFEIGAVGFAAFYLFWVCLFCLMKRELRKIKYSKFRNLGLAMAIFSLTLILWFTFIHHQVLGDATTLVPLWFSVGVFFGLKNLSGKAEIKSLDKGAGLVYKYKSIPTAANS